MRKFNITKNETDFFQDQKKAVFSKVAVWPLLLALFMLITAGSTYAITRSKSGGHPASRAKTKPTISKSRSAALPLSTPTLSYPGPQTYIQGQTVSLAPTSSGVAPFGYSNKITQWGPGFNDPQGVATDPAGNVYVAETFTGVIKIPTGNGAPVNMGFPNVTGIATDAAGDLYIAELIEHDEGGVPFNFEGVVWKLPAGSNTPILLEVSFTFSFAIAADLAGDLFMIDSHIPVSTLIVELPVDSDSFTQLNSNGASGIEAIASDAGGDVFFTSNAGVNRIPARGGAPTILPGTIGVSRMTADAAGNLYELDYAPGGGSSIAQLTMSAAGKSYGMPMAIGPGFNDPTGVAIDGAGNLYVSYSLGPPDDFVGQVKPTGGYFISPNLPTGLSFDVNTGIISGKPIANSPKTNYTITAYNVSGSTSATLTLTVESADLIALHPHNQVTPAFNRSITSYADSVPYTIITTTIAPVAADPAATVTVNGVVVAGGASSPAIPLKEGPNTISIVVTAIDGITTKTYTLTVFRAFSTDANLSEMHPNAGQLNPIFTPAITTYTAAVNYTNTSISITPAVQDTLATITINGVPAASGVLSPPIPLAEGSNTITTVVTAPDGVTTKTYTLTVFRAFSTDANLKEMHPTAGQLTPIFTPAITTYTAAVNFTNTSISITPAVQDALATITINGTPAASGSLSPAIALTVGSNVITTVVTAPDGVTTKTYTFTVTRAAAPPHALNVVYQPAGVEVTTSKLLPIADDGLLVHQGISPNGDGINDFLQIDNISQYPDNKLSIMNRNGQLIFEAKGYDNSSKVFDGHSNKNGQMQLPGTYFYQLDYTVKGITKHKTGFIVLKY